MTRGEIWWANLSGPWGRRPVLLLARNEACQLLNFVVAAPVSTRIRPIRSNVVLDPTLDHVPERSVVQLDNLQAIHRDRLDQLITRLSASRMREVEEAIHFALALSY